MTKSRIKFTFNSWPGLGWVDYQHQGDKHQVASSDSWGLHTWDYPEQVLLLTLTISFLYQKWKKPLRFIRKEPAVSFKYQLDIFIPELEWRMWRSICF